MNKSLKLILSVLFISSFFFVGFGGGQAHAAPTPLPQQPDSNLTLTVSSSSLTLIYDSGHHESLLKATFSGRITTGRASFQLSSYAPFYISLYNDGNYTGVNSASSSYSIVPALSNRTIPPNTTVNYTATYTVNPKQLFAGSYTASLEWLINSDYHGVPFPSNQTNAVTVVGETSPYINSISSPVYAGNRVTIMGARLNSPIFLLDGVVQRVTITGNASSISFSMPKTVAYGYHGFQIRNSSTGDDSNVVWVLVSTHGPASITLSSPNGGEHFTPGDYLPVMWTAPNFPASSTVVVLIKPENQGNTWLVIGTANPAWGAYYWQIPNGFGSGQYKVEVVKGDQNGNIDPNETVKDISDAPFTIDNSQSTPHIDSITPQSGSIGTVVSLTGRNFDHLGSVILFGGINVYDATSNGSLLAFRVPVNAPLGPTAVMVQGAHGISNIVNFNVTVYSGTNVNSTKATPPSPTPPTTLSEPDVLPPPHLSSITPSQGSSGYYPVTISGTNLTDNYGRATVLFSVTGYPLLGTSIHATGTSAIIRFSVPNISARTYTLTVSRGWDNQIGCLRSCPISNSVNFTITGVPLATASLTANGSHYIQGSRNHAVNIVWNSTNGNSYSSTLHSEPSGGLKAPDVGCPIHTESWVAHSPSGNSPFTPSASSCLYTITYTVTGQNNTAIDSATIDTTPPEPPCPPSCQDISTPPTGTGGSKTTAPPTPAPTTSPRTSSKVSSVLDAMSNILSRMDTAGQTAELNNAFDFLLGNLRQLMKQ